MTEAALTRVPSSLVTKAHYPNYLLQTGVLYILSLREGLQGIIEVEEEEDCITAEKGFILICQMLSPLINQSGLLFDNLSKVLTPIYDGDDGYNGSTIIPQFSPISNHGNIVLNNIEYTFYVIRLMLGIFTFVGNGLTMLAFYKFQYLRSITNIFIISLAFSDFLSSFVPLMYLLLKEMGRNNAFWLPICYVSETVNTISSLSNIFGIMMVTVDRYLYIAHPYIYHKLSSPHALSIIVCVWVYVISVCSFGMGFWSTYKPWKECKYAQLLNPDFLYWCLGSHWVILTLAVIILYCCIAGIALKHRRQIENQQFVLGELKPRVRIGTVSGEGKKNCENTSSTENKSQFENDQGNETTDDNKKNDDVANCNDNMTESDIDNDNGKQVGQGKEKGQQDTDDDINETIMKQATVNISQTTSGIQQHDQDMGLDIETNRPPLNTKSNEAKNMNISQIKNPGTVKTSKRQQNRVTKMIGLVLGVYLASYLPSVFILPFIIQLVYTKRLQRSIMSKLFAILWWTNCWINPVIYAGKSPEFRRAYKKLLHMKGQESNSVSWQATNSMNGNQMT